MISKKEKQNIICKYAISNNDTGSIEIQIAILTLRIEKLTKHLKLNKKDYHSKRGLLKIVKQKKSLINYLKNNNINKYNNLFKN